MLARDRRYRSLSQFTETYAGMYPGKSCMYVTMIVTHSCNLKCSYCYEHAKDESRMSLEVAKRFIDLLFEADAAENRYINPALADCIVLDFIGGEPLLEVELIDAVMDYFRDQAMLRNHRWATKYMVSISTNGVSYFNEAVAAFLAKNEGRVSIGVTLDGDRETHDRCRKDCNGCGSYDRAYAAYVDLRDKYGQKGTKFTIAPGNVDRTYLACRDMIERLDADILYCNCVYEEGWTEEHAAELYRQLKMLTDWVLTLDRPVLLSIFDYTIGQTLPDTETQNWCGGTGKMMACDTDGTIYPCVRYAPLSMARQPLLRIGDLEHGIGNTDGDSETINVLNAITRQSQSTDECIHCPIASGCAWCSAYNYEVSGNVNHRATFICPMHKARVLATSYHWNRIYRQEGKSERFALNVPREWAVPIIGEAEYEMLGELAQDDKGGAQ